MSEHDTRTMDSPPADPRPLFERCVATADACIEAVRLDELERPTPCEAMDVRRLLAHLVMVLERVAAAGRGEDPMGWPTEDESVPDEGWADAWRAAAAKAREAWRDDVLLARPTELPWTTVPGAAVLGIYANEITVHTWDLAQATGQDPDWDPEVVALAEAAIHQQLPVADRTAIWEASKASLPPELSWEDPFGPAVEVGEDAPAIDRLVAWNGRRPPSALR